MPRVKLKATTEDDNQLWNAVHTARQGSATVRVSKDALERILLDRGAMAAALRNEIEEAAA